VGSQEFPGCEGQRDHRGRRADKVTRVSKDRTERRERWVWSENLERRVYRGLPAFPVSQGSREFQDSQGTQDHQGDKGTTDLQGWMERTGRTAEREYQGLPETGVSLVRTVHREFKDFRDLLDQKEILDPPACLDTRDHLASRGTLGFRDLRVSADTEDQPDPKATQDFLDLSDRRVHKD